MWTGLWPLLATALAWTDFAVWSSRAPIDDPALAKIPFFAQLNDPATQAFWAPARARLAETPERGQPRLRAALQAPACEGGFFFAFDVAAYLGALAQGDSPDKAPRMGRFRQLGLDGAELLTLCLTPGADQSLGVSGALNLRAWRGLLGALRPDGALAARGVKNSYWSVEGHAHAIEAFYAVLDLVSAKDAAFLRDLKATLGVDLERALVAPLTGHFYAALLDVEDKRSKTRAAVRVLDLDSRQTDEAKALFQALGALLPRVPTASSQADTWGFASGAGSLTGSEGFFVHVAPRFIHLSDQRAGLGRSVGTGKADEVRGVLRAQIDLARFSALLQRVGHKRDVAEWVNAYGAEAWVDARRAPAPAALLGALRELSLTVRREDKALRVSGVLR